ncbi:FMN-binding negative transcriptional regulator [Streptosporangium sp. KLBMP 9127]|nr:FMN-binding negative transcriptional regulator [Streptosporangium sp. KLBMP 9127]
MRMHTFQRFATEDPRHAVDLVRENPFAIVVSAGDGAPVATHLPVIIESPVETTFVGATLLGHLARINPHWRSWEDSPEVLAIFTGPHGYVSPTSYATDPAVPTWDYAAVHLTGTVELITDQDGVLGVVGETVRELESARSPSWGPTPASREVFDRLAPGVVAFRIRVRTEQSLFKLSQDDDDRTRGRVRDDFAAGPYRNPELARLMSRVDPRGGERV